MKSTIGAILLAAGQGKRMQARDINKVVLPLADKPMILHTISLLEQIKIDPIVVVVGFAKQSVIDALAGTSVLFAEQKELLGTGHAVSCGLDSLPDTVTDVLVCYGDDSAFYTPEIFHKLIEAHQKSEAALTMLTITVPDPTGLGRIIRDRENKIVAVIEEKDATDKELKIKEINPACYIFKTSFLRQYSKYITKSPVTGEYYLTSLISIAIKAHEKVETVAAGSIPWRGINTHEELKIAENMFRSSKSQTKVI